MDDTFLSIVLAAIIIAVNQTISFIRMYFTEGVLATQVKEIKGDIHLIKTEVMPNGGKSLADRIIKLGDGFERFKAISEQRWKISLENTPVPIYLNDKNGKCIYVNKALSTLFRMDRADMLNDGWVRRIRNSDMHFIIWKNSIEKGIPYIDQYTLVDNDKAFATVSTQADEIKDEEGNFLFYYGTCRDTTTLSGTEVKESYL